MNRHSTSERQVRDLRRPDRHTPMKVLEKKSYHFVEEVWAAYMAYNIARWTKVCTEICDIFHTFVRVRGVDEDEEEGDEDVLQQDGLSVEDTSAGMC